MNVQLFPNFYESNLTREHRVQWIAKLASISYGNEEAKDPYKLVRRLFEHGHQSLFEFIRLPYLDGNGHIQGYQIQDSLRHNHQLSTIQDYMLSIGMKDEMYYAKNVFTKVLALFRIQVPIFIDRQVVRHRSDSRIEMSRRYVKPNKVEFSYWFPEDFTEEEKETFANAFNERYQENLKRYGRAELARFDQPLNLYTTYYVLRDAKGAKNFYVRRFNKHAQKETRELVTKELQLLKEIQPEFEGQYVIVDGSYDKVHILDLQTYGKENNLDKILCEYGDKYYLAVFDVESGYFVDDEPKYTEDFGIMFGFNR